MKKVPGYCSVYVVLGKYQVKIYRYGRQNSPNAPVLMSSPLFSTPQKAAAWRDKNVPPRRKTGPQTNIIATTPDYIRVHNRQRYYSRKAAGICTSCGEPNDRAPKVACTECQNIASLKRKK